MADDARRAGFRNQAEMDHYAEALEEDALIEEWRESGAPQPLEMWRRLRGEPDKTPLTVAQASARSGLSEKTIRRRLPQLASAGTAWRVGATWRIAPAALDSIQERPQRQPEPPTRRPRRSKPTTTTGTDDAGRWVP